MHRASGGASTQRRRPEPAVEETNRLRQWAPRCVALVVRVWPLSRAAALALVPYALWVAFATVLTWSVALRYR